MATSDKLQQIIEGNENIISSKAAIAESIINKGVNVPEDTKLDQMPLLIDEIQQGSSGGFTGSVDKEGLRILGWDDELIDIFQSMVTWNEEFDYVYKIPDYNLSLAGTPPSEIGNYENEVIYIPASAQIPTESSNQFRYFRSLCQVVIPEGISDIFSFTFGNCSSLLNVYIPNTVTNIGSNAFQDCTSLRNLIFPDNVESLASVCYNCTSLSYIKLPLNLKQLSGYNNFRNCKSLRKIKIPPYITTMGFSTFRECNALIEVDMTDVLSVPTLGDIYVFTNANPNLQILVPLALENDYKTATNWSTYASNIIGV